MIDLRDHSAADEPWRGPGRWWRDIESAVADTPGPVGVIALDALHHNALDLLVRAGGVPIRVASKSVRVRGVLDAVLALPGYHGIMAYTLAEALWLAEDHDDILLGYPSVDREAIARLALDDRAAQRITLMVDHEDQLDLIDSVIAPENREVIRVALDVDASWKSGLLGHIGVRRSPLFTATDAQRAAARIARRPGFTLVGIMMYEAQIAGQTNSTGASDGVIRWMQKRSGAELLDRRQAIVSGVESVVSLEFVNGGGTGSLEYTASDTSVTEVTAGSGLLAGHLFDGYQTFAPAPALVIGFDVVRKPRQDIATVLGGGWIASGPAAQSRQPKPAWPLGLKTLSREGAGEVQSPLVGAAARNLRPGDRVWFRHSKSGEAAEHANCFIAVHGRKVVAELPTYRGEGHAFL